MRPLSPGYFASTPQSQTTSSSLHPQPAHAQVAQAAHERNSPLSSSEPISGSTSPHIIKPQAFVCHKQRSSSMTSVTSNHSISNHTRSMSIISLGSPRNSIVSVDEGAIRPTRNNSNTSLASLSANPMAQASCNNHFSVPLIPNHIQQPPSNTSVQYQHHMPSVDPHHNQPGFLFDALSSAPDNYDVTDTLERQSDSYVIAKQSKNSSALLSDDDSEPDTKISPIIYAKDKPFKRYNLKDEFTFNYDNTPADNKPPSGSSFSNAKSPSTSHKLNIKDSSYMAPSPLSLNIDSFSMGPAPSSSSAMSSATTPTPIRSHLLSPSAQSRSLAPPSTSSSSASPTSTSSPKTTYPQLTNILLDDKWSSKSRPSGSHPHHQQQNHHHHHNHHYRDHHQEHNDEHTPTPDSASKHLSPSNKPVTSPPNDKSKLLKKSKSSNAMNSKNLIQKSLLSKKKMIYSKDLQLELLSTSNSSGNTSMSHGTFNNNHSANIMSLHHNVDKHIDSKFTSGKRQPKPSINSPLSPRVHSQSNSSPDTHAEDDPSQQQPVLSTLKQQNKLIYQLNRKWNKFILDNANPSRMESKASTLHESDTHPSPSLALNQARAGPSPDKLGDLSSESSPSSSSTNNTPDLFLLQPRSRKRSRKDSFGSDD